MSESAASSTLSSTSTSTSPSGETPVINLQNIEVTFKTRTDSIFHPNRMYAVQGVGLQIRPGKTLGIVGESGYGKSTAANVMCGLQLSTKGQVFFKDREVTKRSATHQRMIGKVVSVVFQDPATALNPRMSVRDQLNDPLRVYHRGIPEQQGARVHELIGKMGLPDSTLGALSDQPSGGQRQHVAITRAPGLEPDVVITDEPTSTLDVSVRAQILNLLTELKEDRLAMISISHDIQAVRYISNCIAVMSHGKVVEEGLTDQLFFQPKDDYTKTLLRAVPSSLHPAGADLG